MGVALGSGVPVSPLSAIAVGNVVFTRAEKPYLEELERLQVQAAFAEIPGVFAAERDELMPCYHTLPTPSHCRRG